MKVSVMFMVHVFIQIVTTWTRTNTNDVSYSVIKTIFFTSFFLTCLVGVHWYLYKRFVISV